MDGWVSGPGGEMRPGYRSKRCVEGVCHPFLSRGELVSYSSLGYLDAKGACGRVVLESLRID